MELLKSTGKRGPGKRKKAKEDEQEGLDGAEDPGLKKKSKREKGGVVSELSLDDMIYNNFVGPNGKGSWTAKRVCWTLGRFGPPHTLG